MRMIRGYSVPPPSAADGAYGIYDAYADDCFSGGCTGSGSAYAASPVDVPYWGMNGVASPVPALSGYGAEGEAPQPQPLGPSGLLLGIAGYMLARRLTNSIPVQLLAGAAAFTLVKNKAAASPPPLAPQMGDFGFANGRQVGRSRVGPSTTATAVTSTDTKVAGKFAVSRGNINQSPELRVTATLESANEAKRQAFLASRRLPSAIGTDVLQPSVNSRTVSTRVPVDATQPVSTALQPPAPPAVVPAAPAPVVPDLGPRDAFLASRGTPATPSVTPSVTPAVTLPSTPSVATDVAPPFIKPRKPAVSVSGPKLSIDKAGPSTSGGGGYTAPASSGGETAQADTEKEAKDTAQAKDSTGTTTKKPLSPALIGGLGFAVLKALAVL